MDRVIWIFAPLRNPQKEIYLVGSNSARNFADLLQDRDEWLVRCQHWAKTKKLSECQDSLRWSKESSSIRLAANEQELPDPETLKEEVKSSDRRQQIRYPIDLPIEVIIGGEVHQGVSANLSLGGLKLNKALPRPVEGENVEVVLHDQSRDLRFALAAHALGNEVQFERLRFLNHDNAKLQIELGLFIERALAHKRSLSLEVRKKAA